MDTLQTDRQRCVLTLCFVIKVWTKFRINFLKLYLFYVRITRHSKKLRY